MIRWLAVPLLLIAAVPVLRMAPPTAADPGFPDGDSTQFISFDGLDRSYLLYKPSGLPPAAPLVVVLHGFGAGPEFSVGRLAGIPADSEKFVVAYPAGIGASWNAGTACCGPASNQQIDDVGFIAQVVRDIGAKVPIDNRRVYVAGMSNGGMMAFTLACNSDVFAAIGAVCNPTGAVQPAPADIGDSASRHQRHTRALQRRIWRRPTAHTGRRCLLASRRRVRRARGQRRRTTDDLERRLRGRARRRPGHHRRRRPQLATVRHPDDLAVLRYPPALDVTPGCSAGFDGSLECRQRCREVVRWERRHSPTWSRNSCGVSVQS